MQSVALVPVNIVEKPTDSQPYLSKELIPHIEESMRMDNVIRNIGNTLFGLEEAAITDELTRAGSRTAGMERAQKIINSSEGRLGIFYLDFNNFKEVNDTLGHEAGDKTLVVITGALLGSLRAGETLHRFGGDEFVIIKDHSVVAERREQSDSEYEDVEQRSPKIGRRTDSVDVEGLRNRFGSAFNEGVDLLGEVIGRDLSLRMGLSVGYAEQKPGQQAADVVAEADAEMYEDKRRQKANIKQSIN